MHEDYRVDQYQDGCRFCRIAAGEAQRAEDAPVFESPNYVVVPSVGSLVPGWLLVVPRRHQLNFSRLYRDPEASAMRRAVVGEVSDTFGGPVRMFEHGVGFSGSLTGCGVDHAHLHVFPLSSRLAELVAANPNPAREWTPLLSTRVHSEADGGEYLLFSDDAGADDPACRFSRLDSPESQYFRRLIASAIGLDAQYNYRRYEHPAIASETVLRLEARRAEVSMNRGSS